MSSVNRIIVVDKVVETTWNRSNKDHYIEKGYIFTKIKGSLIVAVEDLPRTSTVMVRCKCPRCGEERPKRYAHITDSGSTLCTYCKGVLDLVGQRYGRLTVVEYAGKKPCGRTMWKCFCDCGKETSVAGNCLRTKRKPTRSCGCYNDECRRTRSGSNHPSWKASLTRDERRYRNGIEYLRCSRGIKARVERR
jgi:hypothetical protein